MVFVLSFRILQLNVSQKSSVPHTRPETPRTVTHTHDEDYSDEESDVNKSEISDKAEKQEQNVE